MVRFKNRYLLVELVWGDGMVDSSISAETLKREVKHQIQLNFGDFGVGLIQATLQGTLALPIISLGTLCAFHLHLIRSFFVSSPLSSVKYWNHLTNLCIIRCARDYYKMVWAAVTMINTLNQRSVLFRLVHLGGTVTWPPPAGPDGTSRPLF
jgi:ribonuclease P/MRP protein subunit POP5